MSGVVNAKISFSNIQNVPENFGESQQGPQGVQGPPGPQGPQGPQGIEGAQANVGSINEHILPTENAMYDLGDAEHKFRHLYLSDSSIWVGDVHISSQNAKKQNIHLNNIVRKDFTEGLDEKIQMRLSHTSGKSIETIFENGAGVIEEGMIIESKRGKGIARVVLILENNNGNIKALCNITETFDSISGDINNSLSNISQDEWKLSQTTTIQDELYIGVRWRIRESESGELVFEQNVGTLNEPEWTIQGEPIGQRFINAPERMIVQLNVDNIGAGSILINVLPDITDVTTISITKPPLYGTAEIQADNQILYTITETPIAIPEMNTRRDIFNYTITSNGYTSNQGVIQVVYNTQQSNIPPVVKDFSVNLNTNKVFGIILRGFDRNRNKLTYSITTPPSIGSMLPIDHYYSRPYNPYGIGKVGYIPNISQTSNYVTTFEYQATDVHGATSNIGTVTINVSVPTQTANTTTFALLNNVADYNQPNYYGISNAQAWCVPTSFACMLNYWNSIHNLYQANGVYGDPHWNDYLHNPQRQVTGNGLNPISIDLGYVFNTNNVGFKPSVPHIGTFLHDFRHFPQFMKVLGIQRPFFYGCKGIQTFFGEDSSGKQIVNPYISVGIAYLDIVSEINKNRPVILSFSHWNIQQTQQSIGETFHYAQFNDYIPNAAYDGIEEEWNGEEGDFGLGHTVICVGYIRKGDPQDISNGIYDWVLVHDNIPNTGPVIAVPFKNWIMTSFLNIN